MFIYSRFYTVAVGKIREQIELNKYLIEKMDSEEKTSWSKLLLHSPDKKTKLLTCANGCCKYEV